MISKEEFRILLERVIRATGRTQEAIAVDLGYSRTYISEVLSPSGVVSEKFENVFKRHFSHILETPNGGTKSEYESALEAKIVELKNEIARKNKESDVISELRAIIAELKSKINSISPSTANGDNTPSQHQRSVDRFGKDEAKSKKEAPDRNGKRGKKSVRRK